MESAKKKSKKSRYEAINNNLPSAIPELYNKALADEDPYTVERQFGRKPYFLRGEFVPPRANQFRVEFRDSLGRGYRSYEGESWLAIKLPNRSRESLAPIEFPQPGETIESERGKFRVLDVYVGKTRTTTGYVQVEFIAN